LIKGRVINSSIDRGIDIILLDTSDIESIEIGKLAVIDGGNKLYLCVVDSLTYSIDRGVEKLYNELEGSKYIDSLIKFVRDNASKHIINLIPLAEKWKGGSNIMEVVSLPYIGSTLYHDQFQGLKEFYGEADYKTSYPVGWVESIFGDRFPVSIPLDTLYNLSFGVFGKAGTGKTFLANLLIAYTALYNKYRDIEYFGEGKISMLIFDTQGEYSQSLLDDRGVEVADGACKFINSVSDGVFTIYALDPDIVKNYMYISLRIPLKGLSISELLKMFSGIQFSPGFIDNLRYIKDSAEKALESLGYEFLSKDMWILPLLYDIDSVDLLLNIHRLYDIFDFRRDDLRELRDALLELQESFNSAISRDKALYSAMQAGKRRLSPLLNYPISFKKADLKKYIEIVDKLIGGDSIAINMGGKYGRNPLIYMAIANYLGEKLISRVDEQVSKGEYSLKGKIVIYLEEAHRFLGKDLSFDNPFGRIAREYRKYGLIVIPIDQKPRELDPDVVSMLWSKFIFNLEDERDADVATAGLPMKRRFRDLVIRLPRGSLVFYSGLLRNPIVMKAINILEDKIPVRGLEVETIYNKVAKMDEGGRGKEFAELSIYSYIESKMEALNRFRGSRFLEP